MKKVLTSAGRFLMSGGRWLTREYVPPEPPPPPVTRYVYLNQTTGGTISASPMSGHDGDTVTLSNTPSTNYTFNGYSVNGATLYSGNKFDFDGSDVTCSASWTYIDPTVHVLFDSGETVYSGARTVNFTGVPETVSDRYLMYRWIGSLRGSKGYPADFYLYDANNTTNYCWRMRSWLSKDGETEPSAIAGFIAYEKPNGTPAYPVLSFDPNTDLDPRHEGIVGTGHADNWKYYYLSGWGSGGSDEDHTIIIDQIGQKAYCWQGSIFYADIYCGSATLQWTSVFNKLVLVSEGGTPRAEGIIVASSNSFESLEEYTKR